MTNYKFNKCFQIGNTVITEEHLKILNGDQHIYLQSRGVKGVACKKVHLYNQTNDGDPKYALLSANEKDKSALNHQWQLFPAIQQDDTDLTLDETNFKILTGEQHINLTPTTNQEYNLYNTRDGDGKKRHARLDTTNYSYTGDGTYTNRSHRWTIVAVNDIDVISNCQEKVDSSLTFTTGSTLTIGDTSVTLVKLNMLSESGSVTVVNAGTKSHLYVNVKKDKDAKCSSKKDDKQNTGHSWTFIIPNPEEPIIDLYNFDDDVWENKDWRLIPWTCEFYFDKDDPTRNIAQYSPQGISIDPFNPKTIWIMAESETCCGAVTDNNLSEFCGSLYNKTGTDSSTLLFKFDFDGSKWNLDNFFELQYDGKIYTGHGGAFFVYYNILYVGSIDTSNSKRYIRYFDLSKQNNHTLTADENKIDTGKTQVSGPLYPVQTWLNFEPNDNCGGTLWASKFYSDETSDEFGAVYGVGLTIDKNTGILKLLNGTQVVKMENTPRVAPSRAWKKGTPSNQGFHYLGDNNYVSLQSFSDPPTSYDFFNTDTNDGRRQYFPPGGQAFTISEADSLGFKHDPLLWTMTESGCINFEEKWFGENKNFPYIYSTYLPKGFTFKSSLDKTCFPDPDPDPDPSNAWVKWLIIIIIIILLSIGVFLFIRRKKGRKIRPV